MTDESSYKRGLDVLRTQLANERTLLAYIRTTLALFIVLGTVIKFFDPGPIQIVGYASGVMGVVTLGWGIRSYQRTRARIADGPVDERQSGDE